MNEDEIPRIAAGLRRAFASGRTRSLEWREGQVEGVRRFLAENEADLIEALRADLGKPRFEAFASDIAFILAEARLARKHLRRWARPRRVRTPLVLQPGRSWIVPEPLGVVLIIGAWNYPVQLVLTPLLGAVAAGNCAVIKPSEISAKTSALLAARLPGYLDGECIRVVQGGVPETTRLLEQRWDHIFYTGNGRVGVVVMQAAARYLTPVTLELGGKSPCFVDRAVDLEVAARRIAWGKFFNAGQTCVAPDYVLVHRELERPFLDRLAESVQAFYGPDPRSSLDFGRIVNDRQFQRLQGLLEQGGKVHLGGGCDPTDRYIAPTVLTGVSPDAGIMQEEIFGPLLPVLPVRDSGAAVEFVNARPRPLALYVLSQDRRVHREFVEQTSDCRVCINHVLMDAANPHLPFGGVGASGIGSYHGERSFTTFSHLKSVLSKPAWFDPSIPSPPYDESKLRMVRRFGC